PHLPLAAQVRYLKSYSSSQVKRQEFEFFGDRIHKKLSQTFMTNYFTGFGVSGQNDSSDKRISQKCMKNYAENIRYLDKFSRPFFLLQGTSHLYHSFHAIECYFGVNRKIKTCALVREEKSETASMCCPCHMIDTYFVHYHVEIGKLA